MEVTQEKKVFDGELKLFKHQSRATKTPMNFAIFVPKHTVGEKMPIITWLSGLTCTHENFVTKAGALKYAALNKVVLLCPDTSPRGANIEGEADSWDFGLGAGFYLNATRSPWAENYNMYDYVVKELQEILSTFEYCDLAKQSIMGHSMGGHGALTIGLKNPELFRSISAFSPICAPMKCAWGQKAFTNYLGNEKSEWQQYDSEYLLKNSTSKTPILVDQGLDDEFLENQLMTSTLEGLTKTSDHPINLRYQPGYDHSYYFISTFIEDHIHFHCRSLH